MRSTSSVSVGVALLVTSAGAFVQAPQRCVMSARAPPARTHTRSARFSQRQRTLVTTVFAEENPATEGAVAAEGEQAVAPDTETAVEEPEPEPLTEAELARAAKLEEIARLKSQEKFITQPTGDYECMQCSFVFKPDAGQGALPGTQFENLPSSWLCPVCKAPKDTFVAQTKTIAGFEENYQYGFGTNTMTGGQKNLLIFGSLAAFFLLFLAGYALE